MLIFHNSSIIESTAREKRTMGIVKLLITILSLIIITGCFPNAKFNLISDSSEPLVEFTVEGSGKNKILILPVTGVISSQAKKTFLTSGSSLVQEVLAQLKKAELDPFVKAVILKVDSPGGTVTASDILYNEIKKFREKTNKPVVASILNVGASGAYYLSLPADNIIAHPTSIVGSVGVIFMRPKFRGLMDKIGIDVAVSKSGKNKDLGSPFNATSKNEEEYFQIVTDKLASRFFSLVQKHRSLSEASLEEVKTAAIYLPEKAKQLGLIDDIGYLPDVIAKAKVLAKISDDIHIVTYRRNKFSNDTLYNSAGALSTPGKIADFKIPGLTVDAGFYYLSPLFSGMD